MNDFLIVGLPIVTAAASPEFCSFLTRTDVTCVTSVGYDVTNWERSPDYVSAKAGHDLLLQHGFRFIGPWQFSRDSGKVVVMLSLWQGPDGKRRNVGQVAALLSESIASIQKLLCHSSRAPRLNQEARIIALFASVTEERGPLISYEGCICGGALRCGPAGPLTNLQQEQLSRGRACACRRARLRSWRSRSPSKGGDRYARRLPASHAYDLPPGMTLNRLRSGNR